MITVAHRDDLFSLTVLIARFRFEDRFRKNRVALV